MEFKESSLYREVMAVSTSTLPICSYVWKAVFHVGDNNYEALKVLSIDVLRDPELQYSDKVMVELAVLAGKFLKRIYPYKDQLEITIIKIPTRGSLPTNMEAVSVNRFCATLVDKGNPIIESNLNMAPTEEALDLTNILELEFQLMSKQADQLRCVEVGGIYRNTTVEDFLKSIMTSSSAVIKTSENEVNVAVDLYPPDNQEKRDHIVIPQGMRLTDVPNYVQSQSGGIYKNGLGYYLYQNRWHIAPLYDVEREPDPTMYIRVINVPSNVLPAIKRSYNLDSGLLTILATGDVSFRDPREVKQLNEGNGVRFANADNFMEGFATVKDNKAIVSRASNNNEFITVTRPDGVNNVKQSSRKITANSYMEYSKLSLREGCIIQLIWQKSKPGILVPMSMIEINYLDGDEIKQLKGVLLKTHDFTHTYGKGLTDVRYTTNTTLVVFVKPPTS